MFPIILLGVIAITIIFTFVSRSRMKDYGKDFENYVETELDANMVKSKPIGDEVLFVPDMGLFPVKEDNGEDELILRKQRDFLKRAGEKMIRFDNHMSNTEIKFKFGTVNLEKITEYEENFFKFNYAVNDWAEALLSAGNETEAEAVLRGGVLCGTETGKTYTMLADIYFKHNRRAEMRELYEIAKNKSMPAQEKVWQYLNDYYVKMKL